MAEKFGLQPDQRIPGRLALTRGSLPVEVGTHHAPTGDAELGSYGTDGVASVHAVFFRSSRYAACAVGQDRRPRLGPLSCDTRASPFSKRRDSRRRRRWDPRPSMLGHPASRLSGDWLRSRRLLRLSSRHGRPGRRGGACATIAKAGRRVDGRRADGRRPPRRQFEPGRPTLITRVRRWSSCRPRYRRRSVRRSARKPARHGFARLSARGRLPERQARDADAPQHAFGGATRNPSVPKADGRRSTHPRRRR